MTRPRFLALFGTLFFFSSLGYAQAQHPPDPHQVPVMDGEAGPCSVAFTVTDENGTPIYDARIRVHIEYGFAGVRRLDLEAATNVDGKTQFKGLPEKVKGGILYFRGFQGKREGSAVYDPAKNCSGQQSSIVLTESKQGAASDGRAYILRPLPFLSNPKRQSEMLTMDKVNLAQKFAHIHEYWKPYIAGELNGQHVKLDKLKGEFVFHHHEHEDEMFLVVKGRFRMEFRDRQVWIEEGEFIVVPRGIEHKPVAEEECWIVLFEPASTLNTGNVVNERTLRELEHV